MHQNPPQFPWTDEQGVALVTQAVAAYWGARAGQSQRQRDAGVQDTGNRGEATGGRHMNAFADLLRETIAAAGFTETEILSNHGVDIPGYFRPTKQWDLAVVRRDRLCAAIEMKSHVGPSFGNNFNNRSEEAIGSSTDFWVAYREGVLGRQLPWLGYFILVESAPGSNRVVRLPRAVFEPMPEFRGTSYLQRYSILCQRLVLERNYSAAALIATPRGARGEYSEPDPSLGFIRFARSLFGHLVGIA